MNRLFATLMLIFKDVIRQNLRVYYCEYQSRLCVVIWDLQVPVTVHVETTVFTENALVVYNMLGL